MLLKSIYKKPFIVRKIYTPLNLFKISGTSVIKLWDGGEGTIQMDDYIIESDNLTKKEVFENANDGQFGCEKIISCTCDIFQEFDCKMEYLDSVDKVTKTEYVKETKLIEYDLYISEEDIK